MKWYLCVIVLTVVIASSGDDSLNKDQLFEKPDSRGQQRNEGIKIIDDWFIEGMMLRALQQEGHMSIVVHATSTSLALAKHLWAAALVHKEDLNTGLLLFSYDVTAEREAQHLHGINEFVCALKSQIHNENILYQEGYNLEQVFNAAFQDLSVNSLVLIFAGQVFEEDNLKQFITNIIKHCKLFVWWNGPKDYDNPLMKAAERSGGKFFSSAQMDYQKLSLGMPAQHDDSVVTLIVRRQIFNNYNIPFPVDNTITSIRITVTGEVSEAILLTPSGSAINLQSEDSLQQFSKCAVSLFHGPLLVDVQIITSVLPPGLWQLNTTGNTGYDVTVRGTSNIRVTDTRFYDSSRVDEANIELRLHGNISNILNVSILNEHRGTIRRLEFTDIRQESCTGSELVISMKHVPRQPTFLLITGKDSKGTEFTRVASVGMEKSDHGKHILLELLHSSTLVVKPGQLHRLIFTVTNNCSMTLSVLFNCKSTNNYTHFIDLPQYLHLGPGETYLHELLVETSFEKQDTVDTVTAIADAAGERETTHTFLYVEQDVRNDKPTIDTSIKIYCQDVDLPKSCFSKQWNMFATLHSSSGIFLVLSQPTGIQFLTPFIIGTRSPLTVQYNATCCEPELNIVVSDLNNNHVGITVNANIRVARWSRSLEMRIAVISLITGLGIMSCIYYLRNRNRAGVQQVEY